MEEPVVLESDGITVYLYKFIKENPGLTLSKMFEKSKLKRKYRENFTSLLNHISSCDLIKSVNHKYNITNKPLLIKNNDPCYRVLKIPEFYKNSKTQKIVEFIQKNPSSTKKEIIHKLKLTHYKMRDLLRKGYIKTQKPYISLNELPKKSLAELFEKKTKPLQLKHDSLTFLLYFFLKENPNLTYRETTDFFLRDNFKETSVKHSFSTLSRKNLLEIDETNKSYIYSVNPDKEIKIENANPLYCIIPNQTLKGNSLSKEIYDFVKEKKVVDKKTLVNKASKKSKKPLGFILEMISNQKIEPINPFYNIEDIKLEGTKLIFPEPDLEGGKEMETPKMELHPKNEVWHNVEILEPSYKSFAKLIESFDLELFKENFLIDVLEKTSVILYENNVYVPFSRFITNYLNEFSARRIESVQLKNKLMRNCSDYGLHTDTFFRCANAPSYQNGNAMYFLEINSMNKDIIKKSFLDVMTHLELYLLFETKTTLKEFYREYTQKDKLNVLKNMCSNFDKNSKYHFDIIKSMLIHLKEKEDIDISYPKYLSRQETFDAISKSTILRIEVLNSKEAYDKLEGGSMKKEIWNAEIIAKSKKDISNLKDKCSPNAYAFAHDVLEVCPIVFDGKEFWLPFNRFMEKYLYYYLEEKHHTMTIKHKIEEFVESQKYKRNDFIIKKYHPGIFSNMEIHFLNLEKAANELKDFWEDFLKSGVPSTLCSVNESVKYYLETPDPKSDIPPKTNEIIIKKQITPKMKNLFSYMKQLGFENSLLETNENIYADPGGVAMLLFDYVFQSKTIKDLPALTAFMPNGQQKDVIPLESLPGFLEEFADLFFDIIQEIKNASEQEAYVESDVSSAS